MHLADHETYSPIISFCPYREKPWRKGFNLVEAAIVLGVIGLIVGGIWVAAVTVTENNNMVEDQKSILQIADRSRSLFLRTTTSGTLSGQTAVDMGIVTPDRLIGSTLTTPSNGLLFITPNSNGAEVGVVINWSGSKSLSRCINLGARMAKVPSVRTLTLMKADYSLVALTAPFTLTQIQTGLGNTPECPSFNVTLRY